MSSGSSRGTLRNAVSSSVGVVVVLVVKGVLVVAVVVAVEVVGLLVEVIFLNFFHLNAALLV